MEDTPLSTVLVVDDERGPRDSLRMILAPTFRVLAARSGSEALEVMRAEPIDLVTLDLNMPGLSGQELMRRIRDEFPHIEIIVITGNATLASATEGIRYGIADYLQKPFDIVQVMSAVTRALARQKARGGLVTFLRDLGDVVGSGRDADEILQEVGRSQKLQRRLRALLAGHGEAAAAGLAKEPDLDSTIDFLEVLAETIETKSRFMRGHAGRVAFYAGILAHRLGLPDEQQERVRIAAFLHDLGKVGVPSDLLVRSGGLEPAERESIEQHPVSGEHLIQPLALPAVIGAAIRHHHEWWDGSGYPDGLAGEEIPLEARIIAIADAFDAMSCDRPYRDALRREIVLGEFRRYAGIQFDPKLAVMFAAILESQESEFDLLEIAEARSAASSAA